MKRRLFKLVLFVLLGAMVNIAVAWGCKEAGISQNATYYYFVNPSMPAHLSIVESGWPWRSFITRAFGEQSFRPLMTKCVFNTLFYAVILWTLYTVPLYARQVILRKRGNCVKCGYDLRGNSGSEVCSECGSELG